MTQEQFSILKVINKMKKLLLAQLLILSTAAFGEALPPTTAFTFIAPAVVAPAPALTNLLGVVNAFKAVGTAFALADPAATALLDQAALNMTLSIDIKNIDTLAMNAPVFNSTTGEITWVNNFATSVASSNAWVQTDTADYDEKALTFRDAGAAYAITAIMTVGSGANHLMSAVDGVMRKVNGIDYTPDTSFNTYITSFNEATNMADKISYLGGAATALTTIQAQALALDIAGLGAMTPLNSLVLPAAGASSDSYLTLNALLLYNGLQ